MLLLADILLFLLHIAIIGFNLTGWIWRKTRRAHLIVVATTAFCWFVLGIWYGTGFCPVTEWEWQVKAKRGVTGLPSSFITWLIEKLTGHRLSDTAVNNGTAITFAIIVLLTLWFNFFQKRKKVVSK